MEVLQIVNICQTASPEGLVENKYTILEIKCPMSAFNMDPDNAISKENIEIL